MGSSTKDRDGEAASALSTPASEDRPKERKSRSSKSDRPKDKDRDRDRDKDKDDKERKRRHHKSDHKHRSSRREATDEVDGADSQTSSQQPRRHRTKEEKQRDRERKTSSMSDLLPELSLTGSRVSLPYPSFSKAHSKENVGAFSREDLSGRRPDLVTPDTTATDLSGRPRSKSADLSAKPSDSKTHDDRPPSPPETDVSGDKKFTKTPNLTSRDGTASPPERPTSRTSGVSRSSSKRDDRSKLSTKSKTSSQATYVRSSAEHPPPPGVSIIDEDSILSDDRTAGARSSATSVAQPNRKSSTRRSSKLASTVEIVDDSPESVQGSSPKTPTVTQNFPPPPPQVFPMEKPTSVPEIFFDEHDRPTPIATPMTDFGPPPPPPPPPPPLNIHEVPRVDYLLQYGGLHHPIPKNFLSALPRQTGARPSNPPLMGPDTLFAPFFNLLDQYQSVIHKQGSVAVATGHKSVARRLLDRLEDVFSRDLPEEGCTCIMCEKTQEEHRGLGWGEVLERVGGRVELPSWPPFDLASMAATAIEDSAALPPRPASPVKLDPDIAEEFREHYLRQSRKVKSAVDKWMTSCAETTAPPSEVDDETLAFAILTNLEHGERPYFNALLSGARELQPVRAPTPMRKPRTDFMVKTGLSLQRLYRLPQAPRDAETAVYLVKNPLHHDLLSTITDINPQEWEILTSGRFDGFLWSGADGDDVITPTAENINSRSATPNAFFSPPPSRGPMTPGMAMRNTPGFGASRNTTPFSGVYSRGTTPASFVSLSSSVPGGQGRQAVSHDEEMEMAVLAEVEREIYQGMEALEDAFERLHQRAEMVRNALRQRNNGLLMSQQHRRAGRIDVLPQLSSDSSGYERPPWAVGDDDGLTSESDWGGEDFDLKPEDSASNISSNRHRRPKRRNERRTPAPIEEEEEG